MNDNKILITGGAGLLGISLTKKFLSLNYDVTSNLFNRVPPKKYQKYYSSYDFNNIDESIELSSIKPAELSSSTLGKSESFSILKWSKNF